MKISVLGAFDFVNLDTGGQPVKSRELYYALQRKYGVDSVSYIETFGWTKHPIKLIHQIKTKISYSDVVIMLPAHKGVVVFSQLLLIFKKKGQKLFYDVVGGWLPEKAKKSRILKYSLRKFDGIWVETSSMENELVDLGFDNVNIVPNFKNLSIVESCELSSQYQYPIKLCTFSRVIPEKGIEDAIAAVRQVNFTRKEIALSLDIYGPVPEYYENQFKTIMEATPDYIVYKGVAKPEESVEKIKEYDFLLFPTRFYTEGIPGTIIDAYSAGVPIVTSIWKNAEDVFENGKTGYGYEFGNTDDLKKILLDISKAPMMLTDLKKNCLIWAEKFTEQAAMEKIGRLIEK